MWEGFEFWSFGLVVAGLYYYGCETFFGFLLFCFFRVFGFSGVELVWFFLGRVWSIEFVGIFKIFLGVFRGL